MGEVGRSLLWASWARSPEGPENEQNPPWRCSTEEGSPRGLTLQLLSGTVEDGSWRVQVLGLCAPRRSSQMNLCSQRSPGACLGTSVVASRVCERGYECALMALAPGGCLCCLKGRTSSHWCKLCVGTSSICLVGDAGTRPASGAH